MFIIIIIINNNTKGVFENTPDSIRRNVKLKYYSKTKHAEIKKYIKETNKNIKPTKLKQAFLSGRTGGEERIKLFGCQQEFKTKEVAECSSPHVDQMDTRSRKINGR